MDELDGKILDILTQNACITVKDIAQKVALTSPAVSERIRRMERNGTITGYTVRL
ncbi:MAG: Lrp/AsnC family transcriptional regulator, partial [Oscillospiraceae bacterium]